LPSRGATSFFRNRVLCVTQRFDDLSVGFMLVSGSPSEPIVAPRNDRQNEKSDRALEAPVRA
jgi:hypothetical protein